MLKSDYLQSVYAQVTTRDPDQREFHQAVLEVLESLDQIIERRPEYQQKGIVETFVEPERVISGCLGWTTRGRSRSTGAIGFSSAPPLGLIRGACGSILP